MSRGRLIDYFVLYTTDGKINKQISTTKPSIIYDIMLERRQGILRLDVMSCDLTNDTEFIKSHTYFLLDEVEEMEKDYIHNLTKGLLSRDEINQLKSWY